jgi:hypothetical protein
VGATIADVVSDLGVYDQSHLNRRRALLKYGTGPVSRALIEGGQLDELHLWVYPFIAGDGEPLLPGITTTLLDLAEVTEVGNRVVVLTYTPKG